MSRAEKAESTPSDRSSSLFFSSKSDPISGFPAYVSNEGQGRRVDLYTTEYYQCLILLEYQEQSLHYKLIDTASPRWVSGSLDNLLL